MFWKKDQTTRSQHKSDLSQLKVRGAEHSPTNDDDLFSVPRAEHSAAVETLREVLRSLGRHAFDLDDVSREETAEALEKWARRLRDSELVPNELSLNNEGHDRSTPVVGQRPNWDTLRRFVDRHRKAEHEYVTNRDAELSAAVHAFMRCTTDTFRAERSSELLVRAQLSSLEQALATLDPIQVRGAAERVCTFLHQTLDQRQAREQMQVEDLRNSLVNLRLAATRGERGKDELTRLHNGAALDEHLLHLTDQAFFSGTCACLVIIDLDGFKRVNDNYGHQTGDEVLRKIAEVIAHDFSEKDDWVARRTGDEFCVTCTNAPLELTVRRADQLRATIEQLITQAFGRTVRVSASFGISLLLRGETATSWLQRTRCALTLAKRNGGNRVSVAPPDLSAPFHPGGAAPAEVRDGAERL